MAKQPLGNAAWATSRVPAGTSAPESACMDTAPPPFHGRTSCSRPYATAHHTRGFGWHTPHDHVGFTQLGNGVSLTQLLTQGPPTLHTVLTGDLG